MFIQNKSIHFQNKYLRLFYKIKKAGVQIQIQFQPSIHGEDHNVNIVIIHQQQSFGINAQYSLITNCTDTTSQ